jgi:hypothetical protein
LESRESSDHRGMYGVQIRIFFLVPDFACNGALWTAFLFIDLRSENRKIFFSTSVHTKNGKGYLISQLRYGSHT